MGPSPSFYPDLKILPITDIRLQEYVQKRRAGTLAEIMKKEGILRHPPIVTQSLSGMYIQLDGANRITAISVLGYSHCLVQEIDYSDPHQVHLTSWSHLTVVSKEQFLHVLRGMSCVTVREHKTFSHRLLLRPDTLCVAVFAGDGAVEVRCKTSFADFVSEMGKIVAIYEDKPVERVFSESPWTPESISVRFKRHPELNVFIAFPTFSPQQVMTLVDRGALLPAGLTRHVVYRRKLNVNMPLEYLAIPSVIEANKKLQKFLQKRSIRLYEEPVMYFE